MATLATIYNRFIGMEAAEALPHDIRSGRRVTDSHRLRALPNEDVFFHVKRIDNSRVEREADPQAPGACWRSIALVGTAAVLLIGALLPHASGLLAGYQVQSLKQEQERLLNEQSTLDLEIATLLNPKRLEELAQKQDFKTPAAGSVIYLDPKTNASLALNTQH